jgi:hypothetical protein
MPDPSRRLVHERVIVCRGYARDDGLWEIEGSFTDTKAETYGYGDGGAIPAGAPLHGMRLALVLDDDAKIHDAWTTVDHAPFSGCAAAAPLGQKLVGMTVGKGFMAEARRAIGGRIGCTHVIELLGEVAGTAFQTLHSVRTRRIAASREHGQAPQRPALIDTCVALVADGPVVREKWPEFATPVRED